MRVNGQPFPVVSGTTTAAGITDATAPARTAITGMTAAGAAMANAADAAAQAALIGAGGDTALNVGTVLHHWRCNEASSPFTDTGTDPASLALVVDNGRTYARAGLYRAFGATRGVASNGSSNARMSASITSIAVGSDLTFGLTVASPTGSVNPDSAAGGSSDRIIARLTNLSTYTGIWLAIPTGASTLKVRAYFSGGSAESPAFTVDWSRPHRIEATVAQGDKTLRFYIDGVEVWSEVQGSANAAAAANLVELGGAANGLTEPLRCTNLLCADLVADNVASSAAAILARAEAVRRLA